MKVLFRPDSSGPVRDEFCSSCDNVVTLSTDRVGSAGAEIGVYSTCSSQA